jgi:fibronectin type 3 domain-containing protein
MSFHPSEVRRAPLRERGAALWSIRHAVLRSTRRIFSPADVFAGPQRSICLEPFEPRTMLSGSVVINEINYNPPVKTNPTEYVELTNPGDAPIDLSGASFSNGISYTIPEGTILQPGAYLLIAASPTAMQTTYKVASLGPWTGSLSNDGEDLVLKDAQGNQLDEVDYGSGFPWPIVGTGPSIQLINPNLDNDLGGSWRSAVVTPGKQNGDFALNSAPDMRQVSNVPQQPTSGQAVTITAKVTDPDGVASVNLTYQVVDPGNYIAVEDAAYNNPANWTALVMHDDGLNGDVTAGDGVYTAVIPASVQVNRRLVRYRVTSTDGLGASVTGPYPDDPVPDFAYYVYDGIPTYSAALQPGGAGAAGQVQTFSSSTLNSVPVIQLLTKKQDHDNAQHIPGATTPAYGGSDPLWSGTLVYNGVVYDDIHYRARGGVWRYAMGKNMWKIYFQNGHDFQAYYADGTPYPTTWKKLNLGSDIQQGDIGMRGEQGLFETLAFQLFNLAGVAAPATIPMELRIVENSSDTGATQYDSDFQGLYLAVEQPDGHFLDAHGLPDGNLYKIVGGNGTSNNQGPTQPGDASDLAAFITGLNSGATDQWIRDNVDLPEFYSFQAIVEMVHHWDIGFGKNYYYYHNPDTNKWEILPWDTDLTWYVNYEPGGGDITPFASAILSRPAFQTEYRNRVREIQDLLYNDNEVGKMADAYANLINPAGTGPTLAQADAAMWDYNPIMSSSFVNSSKSSPGLYYLGGSPTQDFAGMVARLKSYVNTRESYITSTVLTTADEAAAPQKPTVSYTGPAGFAANQLTFSTSAFAGGNTGGTFAGMEWRASDISWNGADPGYEINSTWDSGVLTTFGAGVTIPLSAVVPGHTYRVRVRMEDSNGRWSHWSDITVGATQFTVSRVSTVVADSLRVTELNYNPSPAPVGSPFDTQDFEFIELKNFGAQTLNLENVQFTNGITFTFANVTLAPGQTGVLVRNIAAFQSRYGTDPYILGSYGDNGTNFSNGGEHVTLVDAFNQTIADFGYKDSWYPETDGNGATLEVVDPASGPDLGKAASWQASSTPDGSPGVENSVLITTPSVFTATPAATQVALHWVDNAGDALGYRIFRRTGDHDFVQIADLSTATRDYTDNNAGAGLARGTQFDYRVVAYSGDATSPFASVTGTTLVATPTGLALAGSAGSVTLTWTATPGALSYNIYRGTFSGGEDATPIASSLSASFTDSGLTSGQSYFYVVTAVNGAAGESGRSNEVNVVPALAGTIIGTPGSWQSQGNTIAKVFDNDLSTYFDAPDPGNADWAGLDLGTAEIITSIKFAPRSGFESRMVGGMFQGSNSPDFSGAVTFFTIATSPPSGSMTTIAVSNTTAFRYVRYLAPNAGYGNIAELQIYGHVPAPTVAPGGLTATGGGNKITLSWSALAGATGYNIYRSTTPGGEGATPLASGVTATSFVDATAAGGATYYYVVTALNGGGEGPRSGEKSALSHVPGDANDDGSVGFADLVAVAQNYGTATGATWAMGDFTGDGAVDFADLVIVAQNYGSATTAPPAPAAPVAASTPVVFQTPAVVEQASAPVAAASIVAPAPPVVPATPIISTTKSAVFSTKPTPAKPPGQSKQAAVAKPKAVVRASTPTVRSRTNAKTDAVSITTNLPAPFSTVPIQSTKRRRASDLLD